MSPHFMGGGGGDIMKTAEQKHVSYSMYWGKYALNTSTLWQIVNISTFYILFVLIIKWMYIVKLGSLSENVI